MSTRDRAYRRTMRLVIQKRRRQYWGRKPGEATPWMLGRVVDTPAACDCDMCCNPRRSPLYKGSGRLTMQERRAFTASCASVHCFTPTWSDA